MARRTKEEAQATRNSLLDAAESVFWEKGVSKTSLADIAHAAGTTRGAIYWHFKDKVDLFDAMMARVTLPLERGYREFASNSCTEPVQRLRSVLEHVLRYVASDAWVRRVFEIALYRVEYAGELSAVRVRHIAASQAFTQVLQHEFVTASERCEGGLTMSPESAAVALNAMLDGLISNWIVSNGVFDLVAVGTSGVDAFLVGVGLEVSL